MLLIEQFATVALGLANRAYVMNGGRIEFSGAASALREQPELLHFDLPAAHDRLADGPMSVTAIDHVLVLSDDIDAARDFYCAALGLEPGARPPLPFAGHWLYAGGAARLHIAERAEYRAHAGRLGLRAPTGDGDAIDHVAFVASDYAEAASRLARAGIAAVRNAVPGVGLRQLFFSAPDGVGIEVNVVDAGAAARGGGLRRCAQR